MTKIIKTGAELADPYRYRLWRYWRRYGHPCLFIMLNPSTADTVRNDPTIRRCINYARAWGFSGIEVCNIFALRSTDPDALYSHRDPVGYRNDDAIDEACQVAGRIVCAWGNHGAFKNRGDTVLENLKAQGHTPFCFKMTQKNQPAHPLYQPNDIELQPMWSLT